MKNKLSLNLVTLLLFSVTGLGMNPILSPTVFAGEHIKITRELLLESERFTEPSVIVRTHEGGYVVAGRGGPPPSAWATRVAPDGHVQWRHFVSRASEDRREMEAPIYSGAAMLSDDSVLLCGTKTIEEGDSRNIHVGLITHIDKAGRVISERLTYPNNDKAFRVTYLNRCTSTIDGALIFGTATRFWGEAASGYKSQQFGLVIAIDSGGKVRWEKLLDEPSGPVDSIAELLDGDLVIATNSSRAPLDAPKDATNPRRMLAKQITRLDKEGKIKATNIIADQFVMLLQTVVRDSYVRLVPARTTPAFLMTLGDQLKEVSHLKGSVETIVASRAFLLRDRSTAFFGYQQVERSASSASIAWINDDLSHSEYLSLPLFSSVKIEDAVPTGNLGEFVTVRRVAPSKRLYGLKDGETRTGAMLTFVQFK
jgi:hypothetical protein